MTSVVSGYIDGKIAQPTYEQVCSGRTGHAEAVRVTFDSSVVTFREILEIFFVIHDPTTLNQQGNDIGTQYRSGIYFDGPDQELIAREVIRNLDAARVWPAPIVTEVKPATTFYPAEDYHQNYFAQNPFQPYCQYVVAPKVAKLRKHFLERLKKDR